MHTVFNQFLLLATFYKGIGICSNILDTMMSKTRLATVPTTVNLSYSWAPPAQGQAQLIGVVFGQIFEEDIFFWTQGCDTYGVQLYY